MAISSKQVDVEIELKSLALQEGHIKPFTKALYDAKIANLAKQAYDSIYKDTQQQLTIPTFTDTEAEAGSVLNEYLKDGQWKEKCKGRDLLKALCGKNGLRYQHFRNCLVANVQAPPQPLADIMTVILG